MSLTFGPIHSEFLADTSPSICFEGSRYSGKTWACAAKVIRYCQQYPGMDWLVARYSNEDTQKLLKPQFLKMCHLHEEYPDWKADLSAYVFANGSKAIISGLRSQDKLGHLAKVRGADVAGGWVDQTEEVPEDVGMELPFCTRQPGFPHTLILSPNPPPEDHWISDAYPDDNSIPGRKYYRVSLYDNPHCPEDKLIELENLYHPSHAKYKTLVMGLRGPNVSGKTVYEDTYRAETHSGPVAYSNENVLLEAWHIGEHHPVWMAAQRNAYGGLEILGGIMGKRMYLEDFIPIVQKHRSEWFDAPKVWTCCDPPPSDIQGVRFTNIAVLRDAGIQPRWRENSNSPDVRDATIQHVAGMMRKRLGQTQAFFINDDPSRWLMASSVIIKHSKFFLDGCQANYVWDPHPVSVGSKKYRQPQIDNEWVNGAQRCLENLVLNFCIGHESQASKDKRLADQSKRQGNMAFSDHPQSWLGF